ncbi:MAG: hypothetical protein E6K70_12070 [Planctomycetota bacterium]|nr:MAG: hypothetical protein E6K70_12070 [Planctomycetota bacterium]
MTHGLRRLLARRGPAWFAAILGLLLVSATSSRADVMTFAQFTQINVGDQNFVYSNNNTSADFSTISGGNPILLGIADSVRPTGLASSQDAHLFLSASTASAVAVSGTTLSQAFPSATNTIRILLDTPFQGHSNFLTVTFSGRLGGELGTHSGISQASDASVPPDTVTYSSDVIDVSGFIEHSFALSFSSLLRVVHHFRQRHLRCGRYPGTAKSSSCWHGDDCICRFRFMAETIANSVKPLAAAT